jgi:hypothetical protein
LFCEKERKGRGRVGVMMLWISLLARCPLRVVSRWEDVEMMLSRKKKCGMTGGMATGREGIYGK